VARRRVKEWARIVARLPAALVVMLMLIAALRLIPYLAERASQHPLDRAGDALRDVGGRLVGNFWKHLFTFFGSGALAGLTGFIASPGSAPLNVKTILGASVGAGLAGVVNFIRQPPTNGQSTSK